MFYLLLIALLLPFHAFSRPAVTENEPSSLVEGIVNAVTGDLYIFQEDILIQGTEPIRLKRSYISGQGRGGWRFFDHLIARSYPLNSHLVIQEPGGASLTYRFERKELAAPKKKHHKKHYRYIFHPLDLSSDAQGLTNAARGILSGSTNLKNQRVHMREDEEELTVICPDGTKRVYSAIPDQKPENFGPDWAPWKVYCQYFYLLKLEELPNGNKILYSWDEDRLISLRSTDPDEKNTYASATFHYHGKVKKDKHGNSCLTTADFDVHTSDGRILDYRYAKGTQNRWHLQRIDSSDEPPEDFHYAHLSEQFSPLTCITHPEGRSLHISYYTGDPNDPITGRVKTLSSPVRSNATPHITHTFYQDDRHGQITTDPLGLATQCTFNSHYQLSTLELKTGNNIYRHEEYIYDVNTNLIQ